MLPTVSSDEILRMVDGFGLSGNWSWVFDRNEQVWSLGLRRILGVAPEVAADFGLLYGLIHPDDRPAVRRPDEVAQLGVVPDQTFRIMRPDGSLRTVLSRGETYFSKGGRPLRAMGVLVDVSDREAMARAQTAQRRRDRAIFETIGAFTSTTMIYPYTNFSQEFQELVGIPKDELIEEPTICVEKEDRLRWKAHGREQFVSGQIVHTLPKLILASGEIVPYRMIMVPMRDEGGRIQFWSNYVAPLRSRLATPAVMADALEGHIQGFHIRAGRALLGWSMSDLASASGLSLSTIRRLEDDAESRTAKSIRACVAALRRHQVRFSLSEDANIVLGRG